MNARALRKSASVQSANASSASLQATQKQREYQAHHCEIPMFFESEEGRVFLRSQNRKKQAAKRQVQQQQQHPKQQQPQQEQQQQQQQQDGQQEKHEEDGEDREDRDEPEDDGIEDFDDDFMEESTSETAERAQSQGSNRPRTATSIKAPSERASSARGEVQEASDEKIPVAEEPTNEV